MKRVIAIAVVAACGKGQPGKAGPSPELFVDPNASQDALVRAALENPMWNDSADLKLEVPAGWTSKYDLKTWTFVKTRRNERETDRGAFSIEVASPRVPRTAEGLIAARLKNMDDGVSEPVTRTTPLDGGVLVEFDEKIPRTPPEPRFEFIAVRRLGDRILKCESVFFLDAADRDIAEKICLGAARGSTRGASSPTAR